MTGSGPAPWRLAVAALLAVAAAVSGGGYALGHRGVGDDWWLIGATRDPVRPRPVDASKAAIVGMPLLSVRQAFQLGADREPWRLENVSADGRRLTILFQVGTGCEQPAGILLDQTASRVVLVPVAQSTMSTSGARYCASMASRVRAEVALAKPLDHRPLLHLLVDPTEQRFVDELP